jgi:hypothetical protein
MKATGSRAGLVLQGYFATERFRATGRSTREALPMRSMTPRSIVGSVPRSRAVAARAKPEARGASIPRPDLMPATMRGLVGQARPSGAWGDAPRAGLLPGMELPRIGDRAQRVVQPRARGASTTLVPLGGPRTIGDGRPLEPWIRQAMEGCFEQDFSAVRIHEGPAAQSMGALAVTSGDELHFAPGLYDLTSREGVALLGHELTHVVQQREGRVVNRFGRGVAIVQDPAFEAEADRMGQRVAAEIYAGSRVVQAMQRRGRLVERPQQPPKRESSPKEKSSHFERLFLPLRVDEGKIIHAYSKMFRAQRNASWMTKTFTITRTSLTTHCTW